MKVQCELKAPKKQYNSFGKYKYRSCEDILEAVKPLLAEVKAVIKISDEIFMIGSRIYVKSKASFIDAESGEVVFNTAYAREDETKKGMDGSQITGASSSYARKYALNGLFLIDDTKDADATNKHGKEAQKAPDDMTEVGNTVIDETKIKVIKSKIAKKGIHENSVLQKYKKTDFSELTVNQWTEAMNLLDKYPDK